MEINIEARKLNIISWITGLKNERTLTQLERFYKKDNAFDEKLELTDEMKNAVDEAIESLDSGKGIMHEKVMKNSQKKYPKLKFTL